MKWSNSAEHFPNWPISDSVIVISRSLDGDKQEEIHHIQVSLLDFQNLINSLMVDKHNLLYIQ
jgi:hypothetical protein